MIQSISSSSNHWYQKTGSLVKKTESSDSTVTDDTLVTEEGKSVRKGALSLRDIMGLMQNSSSAKQEEIKEDAKDGDSSTLDADGDGTISEDEYNNLISQLGIKNALSAEDFFAKYDTDGDGEITSEELGAGNTGRMMPPPPSVEDEDSEDSFSSSTDTNGDGVISVEEYEAFVKNNNITDALSAEDFFNLYDTDKDGKISVDEVRQGAANAGVEDVPSKASLPSEIDTDGDGSLSSDEYEKLVSSLGIEDAPDAEDFFSQYDTNGDGEISAEEANAVLSQAAAARLQAMNSYENSYRYLEGDEDGGWSSEI